MIEKKLNILMIGFDWRNIFEHDYNQLIEKLERDCLNPEFNNFFIFDWSTKTYYKKNNNIQTKHIRPIFKSRFFCDILLVFLLPLNIIKYKFKPDIIFLYDFPTIFGSIFLKYFYKSKIFLILGALPSSLAKTRRKFNFFIVFYYKLSEILLNIFVDKYFAISEATKNYLINMGIKEQKINFLYPNTIKRDQGFILKAEKNVVRNLYNIDNSRKIILSVGRLEKEKNYEKLIGVFSKLKNSNLILIIVGSGSLEQELKKLTNNLNISNRVIFAGHVSRQDIWNYYLDADLFILLSKSEGLGLVFHEAMYMNVLVVGSKIEGIIDSIGINEENGFYWNGENIQELEGIIDKCIQNTDEVILKKNNAFNYVENKINSNYNINNYFNK
ncbi:MAG TPA: glycosyltransferase family 4 protein [bacterium]|jgi:glycosyltransferase involved in cell wall biosynthesis|nr:glycosyltransferase family 4 protein [bacterium]HOG38136.1 glycosyltransferase family 4 protein [bacterium]